MKKSLPIIIVLVVIVAALVGWKFWGKGKTALTPAGTEQTQGESFTGKIKDAFTRNIPLKCTYKTDDNNFSTGWLKNKKYYGEVTSDGKTTYLILVDSCMWTWDKDKAEGVKMCFDVEEGESIWDEMESQDSQLEDNYNCVPSLVNDDVFTPPADVNFTDMGQIMQGFQQPEQTSGESVEVEVTEE